MKPLLNLALAVTAVVAAAPAVVHAGPTTIRSIRCTLSGGDDLTASIRYSEHATGRTLDYQMSVRDGVSGTTSLRDGAGRMVASATASATGPASVTYGSTWSSLTYANLVGVLGDDAVQAQLTRCAAPSASAPQPPPWIWYCPILVFVWDEDLVTQLCPWTQPPIGP